MKMDVIAFYASSASERQSTGSKSKEIGSSEFSDMLEKTTQGNGKKNSTELGMKASEEKTSAIKKESYSSSLNKTVSQGQTDVNVENSEKLGITNLKEECLNDTKLLEAISSMLNLSKEELEDLIENLGLVPGDLLQMDNIQQIILVQHEAESLSDALTNESLSTTLQQVNQKLEQLLNQFEFTKGEELETIVSEDSISEFILPDVKTENQDGKEVQLLANRGVKSPEEKQIEVEINYESYSFNKEGNDKTGVRNSVANEDGLVSQREVVNMFVEQLSQAHETSVTKETDIQMTKIVDQIVDKIKIEISPQKSSIELQLNPEHLGNVQVTVSAKEGALTAQFHVQNQMTKQAIEANIEVLKESFEGQGVKVNEVEVVISNYTSQYGQEQQQQEQQGQHHQHHTRKKLILEDIDLGNVGTEERIAVVSDNPNGTVSYTV